MSADEVAPPVVPAADDDTAPAARPESDADAEPDAGVDAPAWGTRPALKGGQAYALATLTGVLYFLGFPGIDLWPLSLVALAPLLIALRGQKTRRATGLGWMAGFTMNMLGFYWLTPMLQTFAGLPVAAAALGAALVCAYQAGRIALCGWLYGRAASRGWPAELVFVGAFAVSELTYPLLFPWYFGASVHNALPLLQVAELGGPLLVGVVLVAPNLALAHAIEHKLFDAPLRRAVLAIGFAVPVIAAGYGWLRIGQVRAEQETSEAVTVGLVQLNQKLVKTNAEALASHRAATKKLAEADVDLVVWSEAALPALAWEQNYAEVVADKATKDLGVPTVVGMVVFQPLPKDHPLKFAATNSAVMTDATGAVSGRYDKHHLLMFGEYLPLGDRFPALHAVSPNSGNFMAGKTIEALPLAEHRLAPSICYEDILPGFFNDVVRATDPDLLLNITNDAWFLDTTEPWIHFALAKLRSVEHRRYLVRATNSGVSGIVDATGAVVVASGTFVAENIVGDAKYMTGKTVYRILGDKPWWALAIVMLALCFLRRPHRATAPRARA